MITDKYKKVVKQIISIHLFITNISVQILNNYEPYS